MWKNILPIPGDIIRVKRPLYYHFGIYIGNNEVIHFAGYNGNETSEPDKIDVHIAPIEEFIKGDILETYAPCDDEIDNIYSHEEVINRAKSDLGMKGYDFIHNNCEDFAYKCYFKVAPKTQSMILQEKIKNLLNKK